MQSGRPSQTAMAAATARARHQLLEGGKVFHDPLAVPILGRSASAQLQANPEHGESRIARALRGPLVARSRIAEDELAAAVARGVRQYLLLGAGLDTLAYRNPHAALGLQVFEVDHPATQAWKRERLAEASIAVPDSLRFVPVDFETDALMPALRHAGFDSRQPACVAWLGVTVYLSPEALLGTLRALREGCAPGSTLVFDHVNRPQGLAPLGRLASWWLRRRFARLGEPWLGQVDPQQLHQQLLQLGYQRIEALQPEDIARRLFDVSGTGVAHRRAGRRFGGVIKACID